LTPEQRFMQGAEVLQLSEIIKLKKAQICLTVATTSHARASANGWFFIGCTDCSKQTYPAVKHPFECKDVHSTADPAIGPYCLIS
ncbi:hypothetical protein A2U01_0021866, partial [Trifolium medium]|nr:hypothetical protein [Trifolium medium]